MRRKKIHTVTRGSLTASAYSKAEAMADLNAQIDRVCQPRDPHVEMRYHKWTFVIAQTPTGWAVGYHGPFDTGCTVRISGHSGPQQSFLQVLIGCRTHIAQCAWEPSEDDAKHIEASGLMGPEANDFRSWVAFQRRYIQAKDKGMDSNLAHRWAGRDPTLVGYDFNNPSIRPEGAA